MLVPMSLKHYFGALLSIALITGPLAAQKSATVDRVLVRGTAEALEIEIQTSGAPVSPNTQTIANPDRIVVDFPGAAPSAELRALAVNRGALKSVRSGLFFNNPPITRIVLDLTEAQSYRIAAAQSGVVVKLGAANAAKNQVLSVPSAAGAQLRETAFVPGSGKPTTKVAKASASMAGITIERYPIDSATFARLSGAAAADAKADIAVTGKDLPLPARGVVDLPVAPEPPKPAVSVSYENGMLSIHAEKATLSQVLFEVQTKTRAEIAIPAGAEQEPVIANLGPAPARDVLGALLNGSPYNFIFVGNERTLERVILTRRQANVF